MVDFNWWFSTLSNQYTTPLPTPHPHTLRHSQDVHKHSTNSCDQHDVRINLIVLVDDPENGLVHQHPSQQPYDQDRDDSSHNLCDCGRGRGGRGTGRHRTIYNVHTPIQLHNDMYHRTQQGGGGATDICTVQHVHVNRHTCTCVRVCTHVHACVHLHVN